MKIQEMNIRDILDAQDEIDTDKVNQTEKHLITIEDVIPEQAE